jgi:hypothetical protein
MKKLRLVSLGTGERGKRVSTARQRVSALSGRTVTRSCRAMKDTPSSRHTGETYNVTGLERIASVARS